jgi:hypothetical protein
MNTSLEYILFAVLFLTQGYVLFRLEVIKIILASLASIAEKITKMSIDNSNDIKKLKK